jgi:oxygen-independent coproporphyrinogen-3 oxidase
MTGLYIHIPFCYQKCPFCDYYSVAGIQQDWKNRYTTVLISQLDSMRGLSFDTLYVGGGTPLSLGSENWERLIPHLPKATERNIELNPEDVKAENYDILSFFNRLSIGVQSFSDSVLTTLRRSKLSFEKLLDLLGHWNVSVDMMVGIPGQTSDEVMRDIISLVAMGVPHISVYPLEVHPGTPFWKQWQNWDWDDVDLLLEIERFLTERGYEHYEISNYARPGHQCIHNKIYWYDEDYYAIGPSAAGYVHGLRYKWVSNIRRYIECVENGEPLWDEYEQLSGADMFSEYAIMNLRLLKEGIDRIKVEKRFGSSSWHLLLEQTEGNPYLTVKNDKIIVSNWLFFNRAAEAFV